MGINLKLLFVISYRLAAFNKSKTTKYDFILLDIHMPIMDGFEACKRIKTS